MRSKENKLSSIGTWKQFCCLKEIRNTRKKALWGSHRLIISARLYFKWQRRVQLKERLNFAPGMNTLVGPNGSGKSTIIKALLQGTDCNLEFRWTDLRQQFDTELMNPRVASNPVQTPSEMIMRLRGSFSSHGQMLLDCLSTVLCGPPGMTLLIDEPEAGLDVNSLHRIKKIMDTTCNNGYQIIVASHHPVFWFNTHIIELESGYTEHSLSLFYSLCQPK